MERKEDRRIVTGMFRDPEHADRAYASLTERGYSADDISVLMSDETRERHFGTGEMVEIEEGSKAAEGAGVGGAIGGTIGAIAGAIAAAAAPVVFPGVGIVLSGPLAAALAGAGAGGLGGSLIGGLVGAGIPEARVEHYEQGLKDGAVVLGVYPQTDDDVDYIEGQFRTHRGEHIYK